MAAYVASRPNDSNKNFSTCSMEKFRDAIYALENVNKIHSLKCHFNTSIEGSFETVFVGKERFEELANKVSSEYWV